MTTDLRPCLACGTRCAPDAGGVRRVQITNDGWIVVPWRDYFFCGECLVYVDALQGKLDESKLPLVEKTEP